MGTFSLPWIIQRWAEEEQRYMLQLILPIVASPKKIMKEIIVEQSIMYALHTYIHV
jgi:hypothetical protein